LIYLDLLGEETKISVEPTVSEECIPSQNTGKIWQNQYLEVGGISVGSTQAVSTEELLMGHI
jgi:hypothetical protein